MQYCNEAKSCAYWLVNETLWYETETRPRHLIFNRRRDRDRDLPTFPRDRDETETFGNYVSRPSRDRDVETETTSLCTAQNHIILTITQSQHKYASNIPKHLNHTSPSDGSKFLLLKFFYQGHHWICHVEIPSENVGWFLKITHILSNALICSY